MGGGAGIDRAPGRRRDPGQGGLPDGRLSEPPGFGNRVQVPGRTLVAPQERPMTDSLRLYLAKEQELDRLRRHPGTAQPEQVEALFDELTELWYALTPEEQSQARAEPRAA